MAVKYAVGGDEIAPGLSHSTASAGPGSATAACFLALFSVPGLVLAAAVGACFVRDPQGDARGGRAVALLLGPPPEGLLVGLGLLLLLGLLGLLLLLGLLGLLGLLLLGLLLAGATPLLPPLLLPPLLLPPASGAHGADTPATLLPSSPATTRTRPPPPPRLRPTGSVSSRLVLLSLITSPQHGSSGMIMSLVLRLKLGGSCQKR